MANVSMKGKSLLTTLILSLIVLANFTSRAQEVVSEDKQLNEKIGECTLKRIRNSHDGKKSYRNYEVEIPADGDYYLGVLLAPPIAEGKPKSIEINIDGDQLNKAILPVKQVGFQNVQLSKEADGEPASIKLSKGSH